MYSCHPLSSSPFNLTELQLEELKVIANRLPVHLKLSKASDGGNKRKISGYSQKLWLNSLTVDILRPVFNNIFDKILTEEWLSRSLEFLKAQRSGPRLNFINQYERLEVFRPNIHTSIATPHLPKKMLKEEKYLNSILPWLPTKSIEAIETAIQKKPRTLQVLPRFHFSYMKPGTYILPHLDDKTKLLSMMIYLPTKEQEGQDTLGTLFHSMNEDVQRKYSIYETLSLDQRDDFLTEVNTIAPRYARKNMIIFARNESSWHSMIYKLNTA